MSGYYTNEYREVQQAIAEATGGRCKMSEVSNGFVVFVWVDSKFATFSKFYEKPSVDTILLDFQNECLDLKEQEKVYDEYGCD